MLLCSVASIGIGNALIWGYGTSKQMKSASSSNLTGMKRVGTKSYLSKSIAVSNKECDGKDECYEKDGDVDTEGNELNTDGMEMTPTPMLGQESPSNDGYVE